MFCTKCGSPLPEDGICRVCAVSEEPIAEPVAEPVAEPIEPAAIEEIPNAEPAEATPELPAVDPGKTLGIISMILGIVAVLLNSVCSCIPLLGCVTTVIAIIAAIAGAVLGFIAMSKSKAAGFKNTLALVGVILSIASVALWLFSLIFSLIFGSLPALFSTTSSSSSYYSYY